MPVGPHYRPAPRYPELGGRFYDPVEAARFPTHDLRFRNQRWAARVGLASLTDAEWEQHLARFEPLPDNLHKPLALRYHGHQFRQYNPALGDGRGFLFAQLRDGCDGRLLDLGTKGTGRTPYSRGGDGRLTLKGGFREVLATEMLEAHGVDTSKTLSVFETGESLYRSDEPSPTRSCALVRLSHSHVRIGTFQRLAYHGDRDGLYRLLEYCLEHLYPGLAGAHYDAAGPGAFVEAVARACARTCAGWMSAGFVHGVLNSDNINVTGESFDYGPYRFLPHFDPLFTAAYFDHGGLYAFGRQPETMRWNVLRLIDALGPLVSGSSILAFDGEMPTAITRAMLQRIGIEPRGARFDETVVTCCYDFLEASRIGFDAFFFDWYGGEASRSRALEGPRSDRYRGHAFDMLQYAWAHHGPSHPERLEWPYYQDDAPCTLLIDEIEALWRAVDQRDDWRPFETKLAAIRRFARGRDMVPPRTPTRVACDGDQTGLPAPPAATGV